MSAAACRSGLAALALVGVLAGCTSAVPRYAISARTVQHLRAFRPAVVTVGPFTAVELPGPTRPVGGGPETHWAPRADALPCLGWGLIATPDGESFAAYIRQALIDELTIAEVYDASAPVALTGHVEALEIEPWATRWTLALQLASSTGAALAVREDYTFPLNAWTETPCEGGLRAFPAAVQNLVGQVVRHPDFPRLLR